MSYSQLACLALAALFFGTAGYRVWAQRRATRARKTDNLSVHEALKLTSSLPGKK